MWSVKVCTLFQKPALQLILIHHDCGKCSFWMKVAGIHLKYKHEISNIGLSYSLPAALNYHTKHIKSHVTVAKVLMSCEI